MGLLAGLWWTIAALIGLVVPAAAETPQAVDRPPYGWVLAEDTTVFGLEIDRVHLGGWLDASLRHSDLDDDGTNLAVNHANGFLDVRLEDRWQIFVEAEIEYQPDIATLERESEFEIEQAYLKYTVSDALDVRVGRFSTPFGYWNPVHWTILTDTIVPPIFESRRFVPEQQFGVGLSGRRFFEPDGSLELELDYSLYAGYASEIIELGEGHGPTLGADLRLGVVDSGFLGASIYSQQIATERSHRERETSGVLYGEVSLPANLTLRSEYVIQQTDRVLGGDSYVHGIYGKVRWDLGDWSLNYRFERSDDEDLGSKAVQRVNRFTIGYSATPRLRLKAEYARHRTHRARVPDFESFGLWIGVFF